MSALDAFSFTLTGGLRAVDPLGHVPLHFACRQQSGGRRVGQKKESRVAGANSSRARIRIHDAFDDWTWRGLVDD